jgi:hypothetical protein
MHDFSGFLLVAQSLYRLPPPSPPPSVNTSTFRPYFIVLNSRVCIAVLELLMIQCTLSQTFFHGDTPRINFQIPRNSHLSSRSQVKHIGVVGRARKLLPYYQWLGKYLCEISRIICNYSLISKFLCIYSTTSHGMPNDAVRSHVCGTRIKCNGSTFVIWWANSGNRVFHGHRRFITEFSRSGE